MKGHILRGILKGLHNITYSHFFIGKLNLLLQSLQSASQPFGFAVEKVK